MTVLQLVCGAALGNREGVDLRFNVSAFRNDDAPLDTLCSRNGLTQDIINKKNTMKSCFFPTRIQDL